MQITDSTFETEVVNSTLPVLVDFFATWCGPCKMLAPVVEQIEAEYKGRLKVVSVDVDQSPETSANFGIMSVPTIIFFKGGKPANKIVGYKPKEELKKIVDGVIGRQA